MNLFPALRIRYAIVRKHLYELSEQYFMEAAVTILVTTITTVASSVLLSANPWGDHMEELRMLMLPLVGSMIISSGMFLFNPNPETRKISLGRVAFSLFFGTLTPFLLSLIHPNLEAFMNHPVAQLLTGGVASAFVFAVSKPLAIKLFSRSDFWANEIEDKIEKKYGTGPKP